MEEKMELLFIKYLKSKQRTIEFFLLCIAVWGMICYLNNFSLDAAMYPLLLWLFFGILYAACDYYHFVKKYHGLLHIRQELKVSAQHLPDTKDPIEEVYQEILQENLQDKMEQITKRDKEKADMVEYYSMWVHQIKTPIAGMSLLLQVSDREDKEELKGELFRIEQYVEMVLSYLRLSSDSNDFVLKEYEVEKIVKQTVKKFASQFIYKKISLNLEPIKGTVLTDEKWLSFVLEQIVSNALKYTEEGSITISFHEGILTVSDTGIGIASEDLPRIFEKGYTGYNGRLQKKSTGIGLYLCKRAMDKLSGKITVTSEVGMGTQFSLKLPVQNRQYE